MGRSALTGWQRIHCHIVDKLVTAAAECQPRRRHLQAGARGGWKLAACERAKARRVGVSDGNRKFMKPGVVTDQKDIAVLLGQMAQAVHQLFSARGIEFVFDQGSWPRRELGENEIEGLPRPQGARTQDEIGYADRSGKMLG